MADHITLLRTRIHDEHGSVTLDVVQDPHEGSHCLHLRAEDDHGTCVTSVQTPKNTVDLEPFLIRFHEAFRALSAQVLAEGSNRQ